MDWLPGPFRPPNWRWLRANWLHEHGQRTTRRLDDAWVARAVRFLAASNCRRDKAKPWRPDAAVQEALRLAQQANMPAVWRLEALLLTDAPLDRVARRCRLAAGTVRAFERLFFCVRDHPMSTDWIVKHVIGPSAWRGFGEHEIGRLWRAFGYFGGAEVLAVVIDVTTEAGRIGRPNLLGESLPRGCEGQLRESARMAVAAMMIPAATTGKQLGELWAAMRRVERHTRQPATRAAVSVAVEAMFQSTGATAVIPHSEGRPTAAVA